MFFVINNIKYALQSTQGKLGTFIVTAGRAWSSDVKISHGDGRSRIANSVIGTTAANIDQVGVYMDNQQIIRSLQNRP